MSLVQLESFIAVAEAGNVGRAAERLRITQPPLTRRIQSLEAELGVLLFERNPRGVRLSEAGEKLLDHAKSILASVEVAKRAMVTQLDAAQLSAPEKTPRST